MKTMAEVMQQRVCDVLGAVWTRGTSEDADQALTLDQAAHYEAASRQDAIDRKLQTALCPRNGRYLYWRYDHDEAARAAYESLVKQLMTEAEVDQCDHLHEEQSPVSPVEVQGRAHLFSLVQNEDGHWVAMCRCGWSAESRGLLDARDELIKHDREVSERQRSVEAVAAGA